MLSLLDSVISLNSVIWLFLIAFIIHDLEEIIFVESWMKKNYNYIQQKTPSLFKKSIESLNSIRSDRFAFAVFLLLIVFIPATWLAAEKQYYLFFVGFNLALLVHVFAHLGHSLFLMRYTPGVLTALFLILPYSIYLLYRLFSAKLIDLDLLFISLPVGIFLIPIVLVGHWLSRLVFRFNREGLREYL
ncbi:MAG TPA: HXXEE domain-containing protein [Tissierellaceae bacterium]